MHINRFGWLKLYRQLLLSDLWQDRPFAKGQAWVDLLLLYDKNRDHLIISKRELSRRWGWSVTKVTKFLQDLAQEQALTYLPEQKKFAFRLDKYKFFQEIAYQKKHSSPLKKEHCREHFPEGLKKGKEEKELGRLALLHFWEQQQ